MNQGDTTHNESLNAFDSTTLRALFQTFLDNAQQDEVYYRQQLAALEQPSSASHALLDELYAVVQELREYLQRCTTFTRLFLQAHSDLDSDTQQLLQVLQLHHDRLSVSITEQLLERFGASLKQRITTRND